MVYVHAYMQYINSVKLIIIKLTIIIHKLSLMDGSLIIIMNWIKVINNHCHIN